MTAAMPAKMQWHRSMWQRVQWKIEWQAMESLI